MVSPTKPKSGSHITVPKKNPSTQSVTEAVTALATPDKPLALDVSHAATSVEASGASGKSEVSTDAVNASSTDSRDHSESTG